MSEFIGLYGCYCHPFLSEEEYNICRLRKFNIGDTVKNRCSGLKGVIYSIEEAKGYYTVKYGDNQSDIHLEHVEGLLPVTDQLLLF